MWFPFLVILSLISTISFGQDLNKEQIDLLVKEINSDSSLIKTVYDWNELINQITDGGGELIVYHRDSIINKVELHGGLSYGKITSEIYLHNEEPIYLVEIEENFPFIEGEIDHSRLNEVFRETIYIYGPDHEVPGEYKSESISKGKRVLSDNSCTLDELFHPYYLAEKALKK